jgi:hypothetical protein
MKYDFSKALINQLRQSMTITDDANSGVWSAQIALSSALLVETTENAKNKLERFNLWLKLGDHVDCTGGLTATGAISAVTSTDYSVEEVAILKAAALTYPALFAGQLVKILDQK